MSRLPGGFLCFNDPHIARTLLAGRWTTLMTKRIAVLGGDGIGPEVTRAAMHVLEVLNAKRSGSVTLTDLPYGGDYYRKHGYSTPENVLDEYRTYDAIFVGAVGDPTISDPNYAKDILLKMRFGLDLYINFRPCILLDERLCPLKDKTTADVQLICFRENTEGAYVGMGGFLKKGTHDEVALQEEISTWKGVNRICRAACEWAVRHGKSHVTMVDKSNVMTFSHDLWQRVWAEVSKDYPQLLCDSLYMDAMCMQLVKNPERYQVIVTNNMFGDILTDLGAMLCGGLGLAQSANINPEGVSMFEPVHGSAPKYAGQNVANPLAAILTVQLMAEHLGFPGFGNAIDQAVRASIDTGNTAKDLFGGKLGTKEVGEWIANHVGEHYDPAAEKAYAEAVA